MFTKTYSKRAFAMALPMTKTARRRVIPAGAAAQVGFEPMTLVETWAMPRPAGINEHEIAYNPSGIVVETDAEGQEHYVLFLRVEPNDYDHIGKTRSVAYELNIHDPFAPLKPYTTPRNENIAVPGEDPAIQRVTVLQNGKPIKKWWLSTVLAKYDLNRDVVIRTQYWLVDRLDELNPELPPTNIAAERMKDVRVAVDKDATVIGLGRPQPAPYTGTISGVRLNDVRHMQDDVMQKAPILNHSLVSFDLPRRKAFKIAANDTARINDKLTLILGHSGREIGRKFEGRDYCVELFGLNRADLSLHWLGTLAKSSDFLARAPKIDAFNFSRVVFPGGFCRDESGQLRPLVRKGGYEYHLFTAGAGDSNWAIGVVKCRRGYLSQSEQTLAEAAMPQTLPMRN